MNDADIIKALECCVKSAHLGECFENKCPLVSEEGCKVGKETLYPYALDLINRQKADLKIAENINHLQMEELQSQKAEIERLQKENKIFSVNADTAFQDGLNEAQDLYAEQIKNEVRAEAITEFEERLHSASFAVGYTTVYGGEDVPIKHINARAVDQIAKEMKEGVNNA